MKRRKPEPDKQGLIFSMIGLEGLFLVFLSFYFEESIKEFLQTDKDIMPILFGCLFFLWIFQVFVLLKKSR